MVKEAAPLVKVNDQNGIGPVRTARYGAIHLVQKDLSVANVRVGMIVIRRAARFIFEARVDETHVRKTAGSAVDEKFGKRPRDPQVFGAPKRQERSVAEVVFPG